MRKYIEISFEALDRLVEGKYVEGSLHLDRETHRIIFNAFNRQPRKYRKRDRMIRILEHGWVKESTDRIKVYESVPKILGTARVMNVLDREHKDVKDALIDRELIDFV